MMDEDEHKIIPIHIKTDSSLRGSRQRAEAILSLIGDIFQRLLQALTRPRNDVFVSVFLLILVLSPAIAANDKKIAEHTQAIASQLSCVVCSGQSVASSNAALAQDMRAFIATRLRAGKSRAEIKAFLRKRYGDKILMRPPVKPVTYILWTAPLLALLAGIGIIYGFYRKGRQA